MDEALDMTVGQPSGTPDADSDCFSNDAAGSEENQVSSSKGEGTLPLSSSNGEGTLPLSSSNGEGTLPLFSSNGEELGLYSLVMVRELCLYPL